MQDATSMSMSEMVIFHQLSAEELVTFSIQWEVRMRPSLLFPAVNSHFPLLAVPVSFVTNRLTRKPVLRASLGVRSISTPYEG